MAREEGLKSRVHAEIFERKNAELEGINDRLRTENEELLQEVRELKERLAALEPEESESSSDEDENGEGVLRGDKVANGEKDQLTANHNHLNGTTSDSVKILTLKRKQKALKAELEQSLVKTMGFKEAFQTEMDLRTKLDDKYENLRVRYERLVVENDHLRTVLVNHCINVPPHQPISGKRKPRQLLLNHPPSFIPPGRPKSRTSIGQPNQLASSPNISISSKSSIQASPVKTRVSDSQKRSSDEGTAKISEESAEGKTSRSSKRENTPSSVGEHLLESCSELSDFEEGEADLGSSFGQGSIEHIVFEGAETPTSVTPMTPVTPVMQEIDDLFVATEDQIENARMFYQLVRERIRSEQDSD